MIAGTAAQAAVEKWAWFKNHWLQVTLKGAKAALAKGFRVWSVTLI